jgi:hypothetical protein
MSPTNKPALIMLRPSPFDRFLWGVGSILRPAAGSVFALVVMPIISASDVPRSQEPMPLTEFLNQIQALETKDFYLNAEYESKSEFLTTLVQPDGKLPPHTKQQLLQLLDRWRLPYHVEGAVVVIQDPALIAFAGRNPLEVMRPSITRDQVGLSIIITSFGVGAAVGHVIGSGEFERTEQLTIESADPLSLRSALNRITREHHMEWTARVVLGDAPPGYQGKPVSTAPDGNPAIRSALPKGAVFMGIGGGKWRKAATVKVQPEDTVPKPIANLSELVNAILKAKGRNYTFYVEVAEDGAPLGKTISLPAGDIPSSVEEICQLLDGLSLSYVRWDNSVLLLMPVPLIAGEVNSMALKRRAVVATNGPVGLISLFETSSRLDAPPVIPQAVLSKTPKMRVSSEGEASLRELLVLMARDENCEWIAHVRPRSPPLAPGMKPAEPGLIRLTFSEKP